MPKRIHILLDVKESLMYIKQFYSLSLSISYGLVTIEDFTYDKNETKINRILEKYSFDLIFWLY